MHLPYSSQTPNYTCDSAWLLPSEILWQALSLISSWNHRAVAKTQDGAEQSVMHTAWDQFPKSSLKHVELLTKAQSNTTGLRILKAVFVILTISHVLYSRRLHENCYQRSPLLFMSTYVHIYIILMWTVYISVGPGRLCFILPVVPGNHKRKILQIYRIASKQSDSANMYKQCTQSNTYWTLVSFQAIF